MKAQKLEVNEHNRIASQNASAQNRKDARLNQKNGKQMKNGSINMNELHGKADSILMRKQQAQKKAMKVVGDAWTADKKIDLNLEERRNHIQELKGNIDENMELIDGCNAHKEELRETYGVAADSQEQKDLELLEKRRRSLKPDSTLKLTAEEEERLAEIDKEPLTEYQQRALAIDNDINRYDSEIEKSQEEIRNETGAIRAIKQERLKDHTMVDAQKEAKEIMQDAGKEIIGMLAGEAQEHIEEKIEEKIEDAKEKAEEKEEQEEAKSEQRKKEREQAELIEEAGNGEFFSGLSTAEAKIAIKEMLQRMKLLEEDLKGANVDKKVED